MRGIPLSRSNTLEVFTGQAKIADIQRIRPYYDYPTPSGQIDERRSPYFASYEMTVHLRHVPWIARVNFAEPCWRYAAYLYQIDKSDREFARKTRYEIVATLNHVEQILELWAIFQFVKSS